MIKKIREYVKKNSQFEFDYVYEDNIIAFVTRENGNIGSEEPSDLDVAEAFRIANDVQRAFPEVTRFMVDTCDEWVNLTFQL